MAYIDVLFTVMGYTIDPIIDFALCLAPTSGRPKVKVSYTGGDRTL